GPAPKQPAIQSAVSANEETGALTSQDQPPVQSQAVKAVPVQTVSAKKATTAEVQPAATPDASALPPAKPADNGAAVGAADSEASDSKPTEAKPAEAKAEEVASANVEPAAIAAGAWSVQIASQPSAESAKSAYQDLAKRYAKVIGGRGVNIVK